MSFLEVKNAVELREILGPVKEIVANKDRKQLHSIDRKWISESRLVLLATADGRGNCDVSPKGDTAGATHILDDSTIAVPERPGNRRADGFHNILDNPHVGLLYVIPGRGDTLRVNGRARLLRDAPFFDALIVKGHRPALALLVEIEQIFFHCSKAFLRSELWSPESWQPNAVPTRAEIAGQMERKGESAEELAAYYGHGYGKNLYGETS